MEFINHKQIMKTAIAIQFTNTLKKPMYFSYLVFFERKSFEHDSIERLSIKAKDIKCIRKEEINNLIKVFI